MRDRLRRRVLRWAGVPADVADQLEHLHTATVRNTVAVADLRRAQARATAYAHAERARAVNRLIGPDQ